MQQSRERFGGGLLCVSLLNPALHVNNPVGSFPLAWHFLGQEQQPSYPCRLQLGSFSLLPHEEDDVLRLILLLTQDRPIVYCVAELGEGKDPFEVFSTVLNNDRELIFSHSFEIFCVEQMFAFFFSGMVVNTKIKAVKIS